MNLDKYEGHEVVIEDIDRKIFMGKVIDYIEAYYNENEKESIVIREKKSGQLIEFYEADIKSIEIVK